MVSNISIMSSRNTISHSFLLCVIFILVKIMGKNKKRYMVISIQYCFSALWFTFRLPTLKTTDVLKRRMP